jgi:hypothetical protein
MPPKQIREVPKGQIVAPREAQIGISLGSLVVAVDVGELLGHHRFLARRFSIWICPV